MDLQTLSRALAMHAALTTTHWSNVPLPERLRLFEDRIKGHAVGDFDAKLAIGADGERSARVEVG